MRRLITLLALAACCAAPRPGSAAPLQPHEVPPEIFLDRSGVPELVVKTTLMGPLLGSALTAAVAGPKDNVRIAAGALLGLGAGISLPLLLTRHQPVHAAEAAFYTFGGTWGILNGVLLPWVLGDRRDRVVAGTVSGLGLAGIGAAIALYDATGLTPGQVSALGSGLGFGVVGGFLLTLVFDVDPDSDQAIIAPPLLLANLGVGAAYLLREHFDVDRRRMVLIDACGIAGVLVGVGLGWLIVGEDGFRGGGQVMGASMLAGMVGGLVTGYAVSDYLDEFKQSADLGTATWQLESPRPILMTSHDPTTLAPTVALGVNLLRARW